MKAAAACVAACAALLAARVPAALSSIRVCFTSPLCRRGQRQIPRWLILWRSAESCRALMTTYAGGVPCVRRAACSLSSHKPTAASRRGRGGTAIQADKQSRTPGPWSVTPEGSKIAQCAARPAAHRRWTRARPPAPSAVRGGISQRRPRFHPLVCSHTG